MIGLLYLGIVLQLICTDSLQFGNIPVSDYAKPVTLFDEQRHADSVHDFMMSHVPGDDGTTEQRQLEQYKTIMNTICSFLDNSDNSEVFKKCSRDSKPRDILATVEFSELKEGLVVNVRRGYVTEFYVSVLCLQLDCVGDPNTISYISHKIINSLAVSSPNDYNYNIRIGPMKYSNVIDYVQREKATRRFTVVDVGGSFVGWSKDIVDAIVDINPPPPGANLSAVRVFRGDITHPDGWRSILAHVAIHGKFDFSICSHTLEDIVNPAFVAEQLGAISRSGFVATPSKYAELSRSVDDPSGARTPYRGYIHHHYIFTMHAGRMVGFPKIGLIEHVPAFDAVGRFPAGRLELSFFWREKLEVAYVNNNFLGPDPSSVVQMYGALADTDDCDDIVDTLVLYEYTAGPAGELYIQGRFDV